MQVFHALDDVPTHTFDNGTAVAIGKFDGVHLGHRALLERLTEVASRENFDPLVFTFTNNPLSVLRPEICPQQIMSTSQRLDALADAGATMCVMIPFDAQLASVSAQEFVEQILVSHLRVRHLCVGPDFRFGSGGLGDVDLLIHLGAVHGFDVDVVESVKDEALGRVSSSRIREAILQGDVETAARMMGRPVTVRGSVVHGDARGRELGFPTANLGGNEGSEGLVPAAGVYAGWAVVDGKPHQAAISVGVNLTFEPEGEPRVEAYLIDFDGDLYGKQIEIRFVERLRGMVAFPGAEALVARMKEDVRETRAILLGAKP